MDLQEPMTLATDYLLAAACLAWGWLLLRRTTSLARRLWGGVFVATAVAASFGGTYHGFAAATEGLAGTVVWKTTLYAIGIASFLALAAAACANLGRGARRTLVVLAALKLGAYVVWMASHDDFRWVIYDYGISMGLVLVLELFRGWRYRRRSAEWIAGGILVAFTGAVVQQSGTQYASHFNANDLYHLIQLVAFAMIYRGARAIPGRS